MDMVSLEDISPTEPLSTILLVTLVPVNPCLVAKGRAPFQLICLLFVHFLNISTNILIS